MAIWEPVSASVYGVEPVIPAAAAKLPPLPPLRIHRAADHQLAALKLWMEAGRSAMDRQQQRHPHALLSWSRLVRLTELAIDFEKLVLGLDSPNPLSEEVSYDYELTGLKRAYGYQDDRPPSIETAPENAAPSPAWPPPDTERDLIPVRLVRGPHGLLMYHHVSISHACLWPRMPPTTRDDFTMAINLTVVDDLTLRHGRKQNLLGRPPLAGQPPGTVKPPQLIATPPCASSCHPTMLQALSGQNEISIKLVAL